MFNNDSNVSDDLKKFASTNTEGTVSSKSRAIAAVLSCPFVLGLGLLGIHNFYLGKTGKGILELILTLTLFGSIVSFILALIDFIMILSGTYTDGENNVVAKW